MDDTSPNYPPPVPEAQQGGVPPFSGMAIAAFICAVIGCLPGLAVVGLILGVVGIFQTKGGRRRGLGLAVASIPISLFTGFFGGMVVYGLYLTASFTNGATERVAGLFTGGGQPQAITLFREFAADEFNEAVDDASLSAWLQSVKSEHGSLVSTPEMSELRRSGKVLEFVFADVKFVNGQPTIVLHVEMESPSRLAIYNISVDGTPLRASSD